eukprot:TRINITY_DN359_c0_g1_i4.p1 TRINITY_DN359_c0_g1~~TRINITY_DN359_c0_g1_i4.p1  ORF type:complete len:170 (+),score=30.85 TRINITY_DN359_c0_g1_i4:750-1259(+)
MGECTNGVPTAMYAIPLDENSIQSVIEDVTKASPEHIVQIANVNSPTQVRFFSIIETNQLVKIVVSGHLKAVEEVVKGCREKFGKRGKKLKVSSAFHSPLMRPAEHQMHSLLKDFCFRPPVVPLVSNVHSKLVFQIRGVSKASSNSSDKHSEVERLCFVLSGKRSSEVL